MANNDGRGGLTRRYTTSNALASLSPIGQQRRQAAGESHMVSDPKLFVHCGRAAGTGNGNGNGMGSGGKQEKIKKTTLSTIQELLDGSQPSPDLQTDRDASHPRSRHRRSTTHCGIVGDNRPTSRPEPPEAESSPQRTDSPGYVLPSLTPNAKSTGLLSRMTPSERIVRRVEGLMEQERRVRADIDMQLEQVDAETRRELEHSLRFERTVNQVIAQSEPTTPPEYQDAFSGAVSRPNRFSTSSLTSPPGGSSRLHRSSVHITSPSAGVIRPHTATTASNLPSQSVPGSRRQSDDEEDDFLSYGPFIRRSNPNRNSMPVTSYDRKRNAADLSSALGPLNTTSFLFDDEEKPTAFPTRTSTKTSPQDSKSYFAQTTDGFPKLIRRGTNGEAVIGTSAAPDLAFLQLANADKQATDRGTATRHRISLPPQALSSTSNLAPLNSILANSLESKAASTNRRSQEVKFTPETKRPGLMATPPRAVLNGVQKAQSSYDVPTLKNINGEISGGVSVGSDSTHPRNVVDSNGQDQDISAITRTTSSSQASQANRQSQDYTIIAQPQEPYDSFHSPQPGLQAKATPFGLMPTQDFNNPYPTMPSSNVPNFGQAPYFGGYGVPNGMPNGAQSNMSNGSQHGVPNGIPNGMQNGLQNGMQNSMQNGMQNGMQMLSSGFGSMNLSNGYGAQGQWPNHIPQYQQGGGYGAYAQYPQRSQNSRGGGRYSEDQRANMQQRKLEAEQFFNSVNLSELKGNINRMCVDQHGCRFLQKKLEERNEQDVQLIFDEVKDHFDALMIDPFGNYLCQRLLEYTNDEQRTVLVAKAVPAMTKIALNQHGTRALQRMIESITNTEQIEMVIEALRHDVVQLIQDLNGNHVIQKCLNHLSSEDAQFIFDAVGANCVTVGTHRHGCCVLQRCVDHASGHQKGAMVSHIIDDAFTLVQDPFGNYVVQYILDLSEPAFTEPLCRSLKGNVAFLSKQKFSSNVMEKCIRCCGTETRRILIQEFNSPQELEKLLRDSYANYVVQTAIDFADNDTKMKLIENLRPILNAIRHTPHGRRIIGKIQDFDTPSEDLTGVNLPPPTTTRSAQNTNMASYTSPSNGRGNRNGMIGAPPQWNVTNQFGSPSAASGAIGYSDIGAGAMSAPTPQRGQNFSFLNGYQNHSNGAYGGHGGHAGHNQGGQGFNMDRQGPHYGPF